LKTGEPGRAPAALAGDDLIAIADAANDDRLDDAIRSDRLRQIVQTGFVDVGARLKVVRRKPIDVDVDRRCTRGLGSLRDERAESFAERGTFLHC
jgi:hypothetical protein